MLIEKFKINELKNIFHSFEKFVSKLENLKKSKFSLIYFQNQTDRFAHLWQEPSLICSLYDVEPNQVLIIQMKEPFSKFCKEIHTSLGFTYLNVNDAISGSDIYKICSRSKYGEFKSYNRFLVVSNKFYEIFYNSVIGTRRGIRSYLKPSIFYKYKKKIFDKYSITNNRKIVVLHVRDSGWLGSGYHDYRDADISTYVLSVKYLLSLGYVVVRIGDKNMPKFPYKENNLIDLPHSLAFEDGDDVVITAFCDLYIGQNTGPFVLPFFFKKDVIITNEPNPYMGSWKNDDGKKSKLLVLFKTRLNKKTKKPLPLDQYLIVPFLGKSIEYKNSNIELIDNTPDEIKDCVIEMLEKRTNDFNNKNLLNELEFIWNLRQISGHINFNVGIPERGTFIANKHLNKLNKYSILDSEKEFFLGKGIADNKFTILKWFFYEALNKFQVYIKMTLDCFKTLGVRPTISKIIKKINTNMLNNRNL